MMNNKILVLEDSKVVNEFISSELVSFGFEVDFVMCLVSAKEKLNTNEYLVAVLDLELPDGSSDDLIQELCKENKTKVIVLTATRDLERRKKLFSFGIIDYFIKDQTLAKVPFEIVSLLEKLESTKGSKILFVDDSKTIHATISYIFNPREYDVTHVYTGKDALKAIIEEQYDLILLDLNLGEMNGDEILEFVKKNINYASIPVIMLSSTNDESTILKLYKLGACDFIKKPFIIEEFVLKIDTWIDYYRKNKESQENKKLLLDYKQAIDNSSIVSKTDPKGIITYVNDKFCEISGYTREELLGKSHNIVRHVDNDPELFKKLWDTIQSKDVFKAVIKNRAKNGQEYYVDTTITPILNSDNEIVEYISIRNKVNP